jgi:DNA ligase 3
MTLIYKVSAVKPFIPLSTEADSAILDGEILLMDTTKRIPLPFGTLGVHKKEEFANATVCVFLFDILYLDGEVLLEKSLVERRRILEQNVTVIPNRIELSEKYDINDEDDLEELMTRCIRQGLEGLVLKPVLSNYEPAKRHWLKMKKVCPSAAIYRSASAFPIVLAYSDCAIGGCIAGLSRGNGRFGRFDRSWWLLWNGR